MDTKITRHTSTNLEELNKKIARLLKDPAEALEQASIDIDNMTLPQLKEFAENGGLGACVSKVDVLASTPEELMYLQGERIIILKHIEDDIYMGYCEGVIGNFNAENVHFVELDPRVLESLEADLDFTSDIIQYRNSQSSYGTSMDYRHHSQIAFRDSLQSYSSSSDHYLHGHANLATTKKSFESIGTFSTHSIPYPQQSSISNLSYPSQSDDNSGTQSDLIKDEDSFDTSAMNTDYSDEEEKPYTASKSTPLPRIPTSTQPPPPVINVAQKQEKPLPPPSNQNNVPVDEYGFISKSNNTRLKTLGLNSKSMKEYRENELKWLSIVSKLDAGTVKKDAKFKKLVRHGIPASVRSRVWQFLAGSADYRKPNGFQTYVNKAPIKIYDVIDRDIPRCYPDHVQFMDAHGQGQRDLGIILKAYAQYNPQLEYCQGMGRLAGLMLMQMTAEDSFWLLVATIDRYMNGYFTPTLSQLRIDAYIIGQLLKDHNPKLAQHLENNDVLPIMYIAQWFLTAFTMTLPWESVLRVWDAFYFEGIKVFYRVSLAIMDICKDHLLNSCPTNSELLAFLLHIPHAYLESNQLLETAFKINLSKTDIKKYAKKAGTEDASTSGLPFEEGIKNLQVGANNGSFYGLKGLGGKITKKSSNMNFRNDSFDS